MLLLPVAFDAADGTRKDNMVVCKMKGPTFHTKMSRNVWIQYYTASGIGKGLG